VEQDHTKQEGEDGSKTKDKYSNMGKAGIASHARKSEEKNARRTKQDHGNWTIPVS
jgi:hypothetical protein